MHLQGNDDGAGFGVKGTSLNNSGVLGTSNNGAGVFGSSIGARWLKSLHHFTRLSAFLTIGLVVAGAKAQTNGFWFYPGERIGAVSRSPDTLDVFEADKYGGIDWAGWGNPSPVWQGWDTMTNHQAFSIGPVSAVSRSTDKFDIFVAGDDGQVWTAAYEPALGLRGWWPLPGIQVVENAPVAAASPVTDQLNIFVVDANGKLQASSWAPYLAGWTSWQQIGGVQLSPSAPVTAISREYGQLELFVTDVNGNIQTTTVYPSFSGWKSIGVAPLGATVTGVSRHPGQLDIFVVLNHQVWTQGSPSLSSGFNSNSWRQISGLTTGDGSAVTAVSRSLDKIDVFVNGLDYNLWTAAWEPDFVQPGVSDWHVFKVPVSNVFTLRPN